LVCRSCSNRCSSCYDNGVPVYALIQRNVVGPAVPLVLGYSVASPVVNTIRISVDRVPGWLSRCHVFRAVQCCGIIYIFAYITNVLLFTVLCPVYTGTNVARKHVSRTSNLYPDTYVDGYKLLVQDTCRLYLGDIITMFIYVTVDLYPFVSSNKQATNWRKFCRRYKIHFDGN